MKTPPSDGAQGASPNAQFQLLRAHVEREVRRSAVILVTSAQVGDGKSLTAYSLALGLAQAGHRTALVAEAGLARDFREGDPVLLPAPQPEPGRFRETTSEFLASSRAAYDYTIVDSGPLLADTMALALAGSVDGVLVTVRMGRAPTDDDESTMRIIEQSNGRVLGIVAAVPEAIDEFAQRRNASTFGADVRRPTLRAALAQTVLAGNER